MPGNAVWGKLPAGGRRNLAPVQFVEPFNRIAKQSGV
jgi:hypothetical protein